MDKIRIKKQGNLWKTITDVNGGITIEAEGLTVETFKDGEWIPLVTELEIKDKELIQKKNEIVKMLEDRTVEDLVRLGYPKVLIYKAIIDGKKAEQRKREMEEERELFRRWIEEDIDI